MKESIQTEIKIYYYRGTEYYFIEVDGIRIKCTQRDALDLSRKHSLIIHIL